MFRCETLAILAGLLLVPVSAFATPVTITDTYIGGTPTHESWAGQDVVGTLSSYDVREMVIDRSATSLSVAIYSSYFNNVGSDGTRLGDLFISTNGWHPYGPAPYLEDRFGQGEHMELVAVLSDHGEATTGAQDYLGHEGDISLYEVNDANVILSAANGIYRAGQEVQYAANGQAALITGHWSIQDVAGSEYDRLVITFNFPSSVAFGAELGFHWGMTCGNDVIEGGASVPEPATVVLLGSGLVLGLRRRTRKL